MKINIVDSWEKTLHPPTQTKQVKWSVSNRRIVMNGLLKGIVCGYPIQSCTCWQINYPYNSARAHKHRTHVERLVVAFETCTRQLCSPYPLSCKIIPSKDHSSKQVKFQIKWDIKMVLEYHIKRDDFSDKVMFAAEGIAL